MARTVLPRRLRSGEKLFVVVVPELRVLVSSPLVEDVKGSVFEESDDHGDALALSGREVCAGKAVVAVSGLVSDL